MGQLGSGSLDVGRLGSRVCVG